MNNNDKAKDWLVLLIGSIFFIVGCVAPYYLWKMDYSTWTIMSWQPYVASLSATVYFMIIKLLKDIRYGHET